MKVYLIGDNEGRYKIGCTKDPKTRLKQLQTANAAGLKIVHAVDVNNNFKVEHVMHRRYAHKNISGEWFVLDEQEVQTFVNDCKTIDENISMLITSGNIFI